MLTRKNQFLLLMMTICSSTIFHIAQAAQGPQQQGQQNPPAPQPGAPAAVPQPRPEATEDELRGSQAYFYEQQGGYYQNQKTVENKNQELQAHIHSWQGQTEQEAIKQSVGLVFKGADRALSYGFDGLRKWAFGLSEEETLLKEMQDLDKKTKEEVLKGHVIANESSDIAKATKEQEKKVLDKQDLHYDIENADKVGARLPGTYNNAQFKKRWRELAAKAGIEIPEEPAKDAKKPAGDKKGLLSKLATPFVFALTTAGNAADVVAGYSFAYVTNLDCFKDTFIQTQNFNRAVVFTALAAATYGGYKLYKSQYANEDDDNILDLD